jgi:hypothetical protein
MSKLETNTIDTISGTSTLQVGDGNVATINLGKSGDTINIPSGATITNSGTANNFGGTTAPYCSVYRNGNQTLSDATWTKIQFNAEIVDSAGAFDSSSNYRYTPQTSGYYFITLNLGIGITTDNSIDKVSTAIYKNGSMITGSQATRDWDTTGINYNDVINTSIIVQLNGSSDYIEGWGYIDVTSGTPRFESQAASINIFKMTE